MNKIFLPNPFKSSCFLKNFFSVSLVFLGFAHVFLLFSCSFLRGSSTHIEDKYREHINEQWLTRADEPEFFRTGLYPLFYMRRGGQLPYHKDHVVHSDFGFINFAPFGYVLLKTDSPGHYSHVQRYFKENPKQFDDFFSSEKNYIQFPENMSYLDHNAFVIGLKGGVECLSSMPPQWCRFPELRLLPKGAQLPSADYWRVLAAGYQGCMPLPFHNQGDSIYRVSYKDSSCILFAHNHNEKNSESRIFCTAEGSSRYLVVPWDKAGLFFLIHPKALAVVENHVLPNKVHIIDLETFTLTRRSVSQENVSQPLPFQGTEQNTAPGPIPLPLAFPGDAVATYSCPVGQGRGALGTEEQRFWLLMSQSEFLGEHEISPESVLYEVKSGPEYALTSRAVRRGVLGSTLWEPMVTPDAFCLYRPQIDWRCGLWSLQNSLRLAHEMRSERYDAIVEHGLKQAIGQQQLKSLALLKNHLPQWHLSPCAQALTSFFRHQTGEPFQHRKNEVAPDTDQGAGDPNEELNVSTKILNSCEFLGH